MSVFLSYKVRNKSHVIDDYSKGEHIDNSILIRYQYRALIACMCIVFLAMPFSRELLEQYMIRHMLLQLPLLVLCGMWIGVYVDKKWKIIIPFNQALPLLLVALLTAMFWMLPRALDSSLEHIGYFIAKFLSLPLLLGIPLVFAWKNVGPITKSFLVTNIISMLIVLAWLYIEAPVRLCNYYLIDEQQALGIYLLYIAGLLALFFGAKLFFGAGRNVKRNHDLS